MPWARVKLFAAVAGGMLFVGLVWYSCHRPAYYVSRAEVYSDRQEYDNAIRNYSEAIRLDPNYQNAYQWRGEAYYHKKDYDKAISDYTEAIRLEPGNAFGNSEIYEMRGEAYFAKKDYNKAISDYSEAIRLVPNWADTYYNRGLAYRELSKDVEAWAEVVSAFLCVGRFLVSKVWLRIGAQTYP